jgi:hypothetical protein
VRASIDFSFFLDFQRNFWTGGRRCPSVARFASGKLKSNLLLLAGARFAQNNRTTVVTSLEFTYNVEIPESS